MSRILQQMSLVRRAAGFVWIGASLLLLGGCKGLPTPGEKQARAHLREVASSYRPEGSAPTLEVLTTNSTLQDFLRFAMFNQPRIEAAYHDWAASIEAITSARSKPDPQLTFQMDIADIVTSVMPGFMMSFPGPGKLRAAGEVAVAQSEARFFNFKASVLESAFDVKRAVYQLHFLDERIRVNQATVELMGELARLATAQNEVGRGTLQDILRAQLEQDRLKTELVNVEDSRSVLVSQLKAALGLRPEQPAPPVPSQVEFTSFDLTPEMLLTSALSNHLGLKGISAEIQAAEAAILAANKGRVPDFSVGLMADAKMNPVLYRPLATVSLPIWRDKIAAQIAQAQQARKAAEARLSAGQIALAVDVAGRMFSLRETTRTLELLERDLLPKARQSLEVARSGYLSGQIDFFNLIDTERTLLGFQLSEVEARTQREVLLAELALLAEGLPVSGPSAVGRPIPPVPMSTGAASAGASGMPVGGAGQMSPSASPTSGNAMQGRM